MVQDPNSVGSALRTISLRLRGTSVEVLEEMGEETDGVVESASKLQEKIKALTGVDIVDMNGAYKDTYTILKEIGSVWEDMSDMDKAATLELMAGKNRANTLSAILSNMEDLEGAYESAMNAEGSALKENETYLDSIQGRIDLFNNAVQTMWMNFTNSDVIKFIVNVGTGLIKIVDNIGLIGTALIGVIGYLTLIKKQDLSKTLFGGAIIGKKNKMSLLEGADLDEELKRYKAAFNQGAEAFGQYRAEAKQAGNGMDILAEKIENGTIQTSHAEVATKDYTTALNSQSNAARNAAYAEQKKNMIIGATAIIVAGVISAIQYWADSIKTVDERYEELRENMSELESDITSLDSELEAINEKIDDISNKNLTITEAEELRKLKAQSAELQRQKELKEGIMSVYDKQNELTTLDAFNKKLSETAANQQKTKDGWKTAAKVVGTIADALLIIGGVAVTGASFGGAGALGAAMIGAGSTGAASSLAGAAADKWGGSGKSVDNMTDWYNSYTDAITKAEQEAVEAESKYWNNMSDGNYDKWQKKLEKVNTLKEDLYNNLSEFQTYFDGLEYNDATKDTIDDFNRMVAQISITSMDGDVDAQISSIQSLEEEFNKLSRGVDENGNNIALTADEYARYNAIVTQVLSFQAGLTQGYDENGNAILKVADQQYSYNQLLEQSIALMQQQRKEAVKTAVNDENIFAAYEAAKNIYENTAIQDKNLVPNIETKQYYDKNNDYITASWSMYDSERIIGDIIGVKENWWESATSDESSIIKNNVDSVKNKKGQILEAIRESILNEGFTEEDANKYVAEYSVWLDDLIDKIQTATSKSRDKFKESLSIVPQGSDYYEDLSGSQLSFINEYINTYVDGIENFSKLKEHDITEIRDTIASLTDEIAQNEDAQKIIDNMFALDASKMPVDTYKKKIVECYNELLLAAPELKNELEAIKIYTEEDWFAMIVPTDETMEKMQDEVAKKLAVSSRGLVKNLSLEELRIAYKIIPELDNGSNFEELMLKIEEQMPKATGPIVETYFALTEQAAQFNEVIAQTSEIVLDNTKVTEEYKESLLALGIVENELSECFDATNKLVVVNAKKLNQLVNSAKKNTVQNVQLAKSQARLQYYELYKEMSLLVDSNGKVTSGNIDLILSYYQEMNALEKTIARYSMLEVKLLGTANAYEKFQEAQEIDSETDYLGGAEEMALALGQAFNTAELGTESARAAIEGLVPESVYKDLDTVDAKMAAIYDYFKNGKIAQYFNLSFDEDGNIESAEMKLGNLRKFIEDGLNLDENGDGIKVFSGTDWQHFELSEEFIASIQNAQDPLQEFADQMGVTKDVAFAFIKTLEDHDIEWLNGDYSTLFDQMLASTNDGKIQLYTERLTDLTTQQAKLAAEKEELENQVSSGAISEEAYKQRLEEINTKQKELNASIGDYNNKLAEAKAKSAESVLGSDGYKVKTNSEIENTNIEDIDNYIEAQAKVNQLQEVSDEKLRAMTEAQKELTEAQKDGSGKTEEEIASLKTAYESAATEALNAANEVSNAIAQRDKLIKPSTMEIGVVLDDINTEISKIGGAFDNELSKYFETDPSGYYVVKTEMEAELQKDEKYQEIIKYVNLLNSRTQIKAFMKTDEAEDSANKLKDTVNAVISEIENNLITLDLDEDAVKNLAEQANKLLGEITRQIGVNITASLPGWMKTVLGWLGADTGDTIPIPVADTTSSSQPSTVKKNTRSGNAMYVNGTAHTSGHWGLPRNEHNSLVGELGPEMVVDPYSGRYYTVGDSGAEMVDLPRGAIIFNHKQTEGLLKNGYVTSRGKAYADGNAHVTIWPQGSSKTQWEGTGYSSWDDPTYDATEALANSLDDASDSVGEFEESIDWIEIRMEELDEALSLYSANLENAAVSVDKNNIIDQMIAVNEDIYSNAIAGAKYYQEYADKYLAGMNSQLVAAAKDGSIAITEFTKEQDESTVNAIQKYREFAQKASDLTQKAVETITEIRGLAIQKIDNAQTTGDVKATVEDSQTEKLQNAVDLIEESGNIADDDYYLAMMENSNKKVEYLTAARKEMQKEFDDAVKSGALVRGSDEWYENLDKLYQIDSEIAGATKELEEFQNAINDIYWDNFDQLISRFDYVKEDMQGLIDLMDSADMVTNSEDRQYMSDGEKYWTADDVSWTDEGLATMGLYAQQMEVSEIKARQYAKAIDDLKADFDDGKYSENEYLEKLNELTSSQYDAIESYHDAQDAIKDLNSEMIDMVKEGIKKQIDAYSELAEKRKEALDAEKDAYDWQKSISKQQKSILDIDRQLAALTGDNSISAAAKRKRLEAERAELQSELDDMYYDKSIENQKEAIDKEVDTFKEGKEQEIEELDKYLENVEQVVADSLNLIQENASGIYDTLSSKADEYNLTLHDAILTPWKDGEFAISDYQNAFDTAVSSTTDKLNSIEQGWRDVIDATNDAAKATVDAMHAQNNAYAAAEKQEIKTEKPKQPSETKTSSSVKSVAVGSTINAGGATIYATSAGGGANTQYYGSDPIYVVIGENGGYWMVRHRSLSSGVTGWFKKSDVSAYAKGTTGTKKDELAWIDELGPELQLVPDGNGRLEYIRHGTAIIPHDISENLIQLGQLDPSIMLDQNRPVIGAPHVTNNSIQLSMDIAEVVHIDTVTNDTIPNLTKAIEKQMDKYMKGINAELRKYTR